MWKPIKDLNWQKEALCAQPENQDKKEWFFSPSAEERYKAKNLCFQCPVRKECAQWALENKQIWGVWGGRDEVDLRRALSVNHEGEETRRRRFPNCPYCGARPAKLTSEVVEIPDGGRWKTAKIVICSSCDFSWRSRTSANAVEAYHQDRAKRLEKQEKEKTKKARTLSKPRSRKISGSAEVSRPSD